MNNRGKSTHSTKRVPTEIKELKGTLQKHNMATEPIRFEPLRDNPNPPPYFGEIATDEWNRILDQYKATKIFSVLDLPSIAIYCKAVERVHEIEVGLSNGTYKEFFTLQTGYRQIDPIISILTKAKDDIKVYGERLGVTPVSRTKVSGLLGGKKGEEKDPFEELYGKKKAQ